ncbi:E3 ubiquitin-protein ligase TRIM56-like isoform X3 [Ostrea edulis]|uniref:E3 ubiquitin-protein ligase TRIM56-like isoform X3 n=1 Tax=Ostrea edulis TaxID=37623 RepID=UPI0024AF2F79|nr:E3 ubiquitin-protein ligase TRIM56-like isoform X3 [Ostrea edulis]
MIWATKRCASMDTEQSELVIPRQLLCCKLCDEEFTKPCYLPCLHTFCQECIDEHRLSSTDKEGYFPCPTCMTEVNPEEDDGVPRNLPENILARRLSIPANDPIKRETLCFYCKNAGNFVEGKTHCVDCNEFLCKPCADSHTTQEDFSDHHLQSDEDYNAEKTTSTSSQSQVIPVCCEAYDPLDFGAMYCVDCDISVCADCHVNKHGEHRCAELMAIAQHFETKIKEPLQELDNDSEHISKFLVNLNATEHNLLEQKDSLKHHVKERTKQLCSLIKDYEKLLLDDIERRFDDQIEDIKTRRLDLKMHLEAIKGVKDFTENLITYGSYEEKVLLRKKVGYRIRELCEESLGTDPIEILSVKLVEPNVTGDSICDMFGTIQTGEQSVTSESEHTVDDLTSQHFQRYHSFGDSGHGSDTMDHAENEPELVEIFEKAPIDLQRQDSKQDSSDTDMLSSSNSSDKMKNVKFKEHVDQNEFENDNVFNLENPKREVTLPAPIQKECIKGIGINEKGDIIVGTTTTVHVLEKRGIVRGQVPLENGWNIHSVSSDGKVSMTVPRGDNRFKVRVLKNDGTGHIMSDFHVESFGLNFVTADQSGTLIITSNRYAQIHKNHGKSAKSGGNIAFYGSDGHLIRRITNEDFHANLLEKPQMVAVDEKRNKTYVADPGSHRVIALNANGELVFEYGNIDDQEEIYQGPDLISIDKYGNIIVTDKREGRIDILGTKGNLKKSFFTDDIPRFVGATPDKFLVTAMPDGSMKFYDYLG